MEKKQIVKFLKEKKRGVYTLIVEVYADVITAMAVSMALDIIKGDLEKESGDIVDLNYFSLAKAISKSKAKAPSGSSITAKLQFKDAHELAKDQTSPGKFKLVQPG